MAAAPVLAAAALDGPLISPLPSPCFASAERGPTKVTCPYSARVKVGTERPLGTGSCSRILVGRDMVDDSALGVQEKGRRVVWRGLWI